MDALSFISIILLEKMERRITKGKHSEGVARLEVTKVDLEYCKLVNNTYQQYSRELHKFKPKTHLDS